MTPKLLKTSGAICLVIFSLFLVLSSLAVRDSNYAAIDGSLRQHIEHRSDAATHGRVAAISLIAAVVLLLLGYYAGRDRRKCPQCAESVKKEAEKCRYCGAELIPQVP